MGFSPQIEMCRCCAAARGVTSPNRAIYIMCLMQWGSGEGISSVDILIPVPNYHKLGQISSWQLSGHWGQHGVKRLPSVIGLHHFWYCPNVAMVGDQFQSQTKNQPASSSVSGNRASFGPLHTDVMKINSFWKIAWRAASALIVFSHSPFPNRLSSLSVSSACFLHIEALC